MKSSNPITVQLCGNGKVIAETDDPRTAMSVLKQILDEKDRGKKHTTRPGGE